MQDTDSIQRRGMASPSDSISSDLSRLAQTSEASITEVDKSMHQSHSSATSLKMNGSSLASKLMLVFFSLGVLCLISVGILSYLISKRPPDPVTLTYWGTTMSPKTMEPIIAAFQAQYPYITVTYSQESLPGYEDKLLARIPAGTGPDMYEYHVSWLPMLKQLLIPLNPMIAPDQMKGAYYPVVANDLIRNSTVYGIPLGIDTLSLFINQDILQASGLNVPTTWKEFSDTAYALTVKDTTQKVRIAGAALGGYDNISYAPDILAALLIQNGADPLTISQNIQQTLDALTFYTTFSQGTTPLWNDTLDLSKNGFTKGTLAMYLGYLRDASEIKAVNPQLNFSVNPLPHLPGRQVTVASYFAQGVSSQTPYSNAALLFMHYLNKQETQQRLYASEVQSQPIVYTPAQSSLANLVSSDPALSVVAAQVPNAVSSIFVGGTGDTTGIDAQVNGYLRNIVLAQQTGQLSSDSDTMKAFTGGIAKVLSHYK